MWLFLVTPRRAYLLILLLLSWTNRSGCFQAPTSAFKRRRRQNGAAASYQAECVPALVVAGRRLSRTASGADSSVSYRHPTELRLSRQSAGLSVSQHSSQHLSHLGLRASSKEQQAPSSSKIRSFTKRLIKVLTYPLRFAIVKPIRWIISKFQSDEKETEAIDVPVATAEPVSFEDLVADSIVVPDHMEMETEVQMQVEDLVADAIVREGPVVQTQAVGTAELTLLEPSVQEEELAVAKTEVRVIEKEVQEKSERMPVEKKQARVSSTGQPAGDRWAIATPGMDLSGNWTLLVSDDFRKQYDEYLKQLGQPFLVRSVALTIVGMTTEETRQSQDGRTLLIRGVNARGVWERTLVSSGTDLVNDQYTPLLVPVHTADDELVEAESWWGENGTVHRSWMRGISKYGGGDFESKRYLQKDSKVLVCESIFHPREKEREDVSVTWRFLRDGESLN